MKLSSIVPSEMSNKELKSICASLQIAKNWKFSKSRVDLANGQQYDVEVKDLQDYQEAFQTECGALTL